MEKFKLYPIIAEGLGACGISRNCARAILLMLETDEQTQAMLDWLLKVEEVPTEEDCLWQAVMITQDSTSSAPTP